VFPDSRLQRKTARASVRPFDLIPRARSPQTIGQPDVSYFLVAPPEERRTAASIRVRCSLTSRDESMPQSRSAATAHATSTDSAVLRDRVHDGVAIAIVEVGPTERVELQHAKTILGFDQIEHIYRLGRRLRAGQQLRRRAR
jgi:hypothetical protein